MGNILDLSSYSLETTGRRLRIMEEVHEFTDIPGSVETRQRISEEICAAVMQHRLHFLSLFLGSAIRIFDPFRMGRRMAADFFVDRDVETPELKEYDKAFGKILSVPEELIDAYLNSCSAYHSALFLRDANYEAAFALLVTAVECVSNTHYPKGHLKERFQRFVTEFLPEDKAFVTPELKYLDKELTRGESDALLQQLLESIYCRLRSGFVHFGKPTPLGSRLADKLQLAYVKTGEGKPHSPGRVEAEFFNPSFGWFKRIVGEVLVNFLYMRKEAERKDLHKLLMPSFTTRVKAGRLPVDAGQNLYDHDLELQ